MYQIFSFILQGYVVYHGKLLVFPSEGAAHRFLHEHQTTDFKGINPCIIVKMG